MSMSAASVAKLNRENLFRWPLAHTCASDECRKNQSFFRRILDRTATVKFGGSQFCFPNCFERELRRRLEVLSIQTSLSRVRSRRIPLGLLMLSRGVLSKEQLLCALHEQKQTGTGRIGEWLREMGFVAEQDVTAALAMQRSCPLLRKLPLQAGTYGIPIHLLQAFRMAPIHLSRATDTLHIAFAEEISYPALVSIEQMLQVKTEACLTTQPELDAALARAEEIKPAKEKLFENLRGLTEIVRVISGYAEKLGGSEVRLTACGDYFWARIPGVVDAVDLIFSRRKIVFDVAS